MQIKINYSKRNEAEQYRVALLYHFCVAKRTRCNATYKCALHTAEGLMDFEGRRTKPIAENREGWNESGLTF